MTTIVQYNEKVLHEPCKPFDFNNPSTDPKVLANTLMLAKEARNGYGLAANQIGINLRVFVFLETVAFNPEVIETDGYHLMTEGCLSYPGLFIQLRRAQQIKVKYFDEKGALHSRWLDNLETRVFLHEIDHLDGVTFVDNASDLKLRRAIEQANKHGHSYSFKELRNHP